MPYVRRRFVRRPRLFSRKRSYRTYSRGYRRPFRRFNRRRIPLVEPNSQMVKLKYSDVFTLYSGAGMVLNTMRLNSLFDPDGSGAGGTPTGYPEWSSLYSNYRVMAAKVHMHITQNCDQAILCGGFWGNDERHNPSTATAAQQTLLEGYQAAYRFFPVKNASATAAEKNIKVYIPIRRLFPSGTKDLDLSAAVGANPAKQAFFVLTNVEANGSALQAVSAIAIVTITYYVKFFGKHAVYTD